jgi:transposase InsO family protein
LIQGIELTGPNQLWVSDITYWKLNGEFLYISLITDAFSRMIVGYQLADSLEAVESIGALKMALRKLEKTITNLIHHSDRGVQYCSYDYTDILHDKGIKISMTESGDPLDNAIAERMNGILKYEYLFEEKVESIKQAKEILEKSVNLYNTDRPHMSIGNMTPVNVHNLQMDRELKRKWKNYYKKQTEQSVI